MSQRRKAAFIDWMEANDLNVNRVAKATGISVNTLYSYVNGPTQFLTVDKEAKIARTYDLPVEAIFGPVEITPDIEPNFVQAWREHYHLTRKELAKRIGSTEENIRLLEEGQSTFSAKWQRRIADALKVGAGYLHHHPDTLTKDVLTLIGIPEERQELASQVMETFRVAG